MEISNHPILKNCTWIKRS